MADEQKVSELEVAATVLPTNIIHVIQDDGLGGKVSKQASLATVSTLIIGDVNAVLFDKKTILIDGDFNGMYRVSATKKITPPDLGFGYTITNVKVQCASADPTTEFAGDLKWCDAQGTGAFPSTNPTVIKVLDTTTGNYDSGAITENVATGKELYIQMDSQTDYGVMWTITITYQLKTS